jgi:hypothetical protein
VNFNIFSFESLVLDYNIQMDWWGWLYPKKCLGCGEWGGYICRNCEVGLWEAEQVCWVCGREAKWGRVHAGCGKRNIRGLSCLWAGGLIINRAKNMAERGFGDALKELTVRGIEIMESEGHVGWEEVMRNNPTVMALEDEISEVVANEVANKWKLKRGKVGRGVLVVGGEWDRKFREQLLKLGNTATAGWGLALSG